MTCFDLFLHLPDKAQSVLSIFFGSRISLTALSCTEAALILPWPLKYCSATTTSLLVLYQLCFDTDYLGVVAQKGVYISLNRGIFSLSVYISSFSMTRSMCVVSISSPSPFRMIILSIVILKSIQGSQKDVFHKQNMAHGR
jgi:hypothetical protein